MNPSYDAVAAIAQHRCEYCRAPELAFNFPFEVEHIIPKSKQGSDSLDNLALACRSCNLHKSNHISIIDPDTQTETTLFNPRQDTWENHFQITSRQEIFGLTAIGRVTVICLNMNNSSQIFARRLWIQWNLFP
ncbi:MAG: HNH endonuclease [Alkalinema sp. CACIAM 70d]|nr:MAG: HNH endonuclease [Alkalinema sp. CACIAM 70d]